MCSRPLLLFIFGPVSYLVSLDAKLGEMNVFLNIMRHSGKFGNNSTIEIFVSLLLKQTSLITVGNLDSLLNNFVLNNVINFTNSIIL